MILQGRKKELAGLRLFPKGNKYRHSDSIIRSSRIVCGAYAIRPYIGGCAHRFLSPFLSLMKEKEAKENQGVRDASQIYRVPAGDVRDTDPIRHIRPIFPGLGRGLDLFLPSFLLSREEKKVPFIRGMRQRERFCLLLSPFLSLMKEKEVKENQGVRDAGQIYRVPAGDVRDTSQIGRVRDASM